MKLRSVIFSAMIVGLAALPGCGKKDEPKTETPSSGSPTATNPPANPTQTGGTATTPGTTATTPVEQPRPAFPPEEVAKVIGLGAELPADYRSFVMVDVDATRKGFMETALGKKIETLAKETVGIELPEAPKPAAAPSENEPATAPTKDPGELMLQFLGGGRCYLATGPESADSAYNALKLIGFVQGLTFQESMLQMARGLGLAEGEAGSPPDFQQAMSKNHAKLMSLVEPVKVPGVLFAVETKGRSADAKEMLSKMDGELTESLANEAFIKREEIQREGATFVTFSVSPGDMVGPDDLEGAFEGIDAATIEKYHKILRDKKVVFGFGLKGDHILFFLGSDPSQIRFVSKVSDSLATRPEFQMLGSYKNTKPFMVGMADGDLLAKMRAGQDTGMMFDSLREVLDQCTKLGDTKDVAALLERLSATMRELSKGHDEGMCASCWFENGIRLEVSGGPDSPELDVSQPLGMVDRLATEDTVLIASARVNRAFTDKAINAYEDMAEIGYELARRYAATDAAKEKGFQEQLNMFHEKLRPHVVAAWGALMGDTGLGSEAAMIMDMGGAAPKVPGLPPAVTEKVHVPRFTLAYPLEDRAKLDATWKKLEPAVKSFIDNLPIEGDKKPTLPDPFSSEKNGIKTWFYGISGLTNDDFVPSVSMGDKFFFLGSSKNLSEALATRLAAPAPPTPAPRGMIFEMRFGPVAQAATEWMDALSQNAEAVFKDADQRGEFLSNEKDVRKFIDVARCLDRLRITRAPEGKTWHTSIHLQFAPEAKGK